MLAYLAGASDAAEAIAGEEGPPGHVREWATKMLERVKVSRKGPAKVRQPRNVARRRWPATRFSLAPGGILLRYAVTAGASPPPGRLRQPVSTQTSAT